MARKHYSTVFDQAARLIWPMMCALDLLTAAQKRQANRDAAECISALGGKFTDAAERHLERRFLASQTRW
jgi:hypothetical protein